MYIYCTEQLQIHQCISDSGTESLTTHGNNISHLKTYFIHYLLQPQSVYIQMLLIIHHVQLL